MLLGAEIEIFTDHKNLTYSSSVNQRIVRQLNYIDEFAPTYTHIPGEENFLADSFSRLPIRNDLEYPSEEEKLRWINMDMELQKTTSILSDVDLVDCFLNLPDLHAAPFPLDFAHIAQGQQLDQSLLHRRIMHPMQYPNQQFQGIELMSYRPTADAAWKICIPSQQLEELVSWFHQALGHCGIHRLNDSIGTHFAHPKLRQTVETAVANCHACQLNKLTGPGYGKLPPREATALPFQEVAVDLIGPWRVTVNNETLEFYALTCIDLATNFPEAIRIRSKHVSHVGMHFENIWLSRYPRPMKCIHDQGTEFIGADFQEVLRRAGIQDVPTSVRNPQANAVCERLHQSVGNTLRILLTANPPDNVTNIVEMIDSSLATALHAARSAIHRTLGVSPGGLVFQRDMFLDIPLLNDFQLIQERWQTVIDDNLRRANTRRRHYDYQPGNECLIIQHSPNKLESRKYGPFTIEMVHTNGTVTIRRDQHTTERMSIRHIVPYRRLPPN
jgi:transposase InsO family protein